MGTYEPPVSTLIGLGRPDVDELDQVDYTQYGIGPEHIPELLRLMRDDDIEPPPEGEEDDEENDKPEYYAYVHAWRALGQLRAEAAVEPLLDLLAEQDGEDWNDWVMEEVPQVLGLFGPAVIPALVRRLEQRGKLEHSPCYVANALTEVAKRHPETRDTVIAELCRALDTAVDNDPGVNGFFVSDLMDLMATEAMPVIERAYATENVDESICGDIAEVKFLMKLGPEPRRQYQPLPQPRSIPRHFSPHTGLTPKERAEERKAKKKQEKKRRKGK